MRKAPGIIPGAFLRVLEPNDVHAARLPVFCFRQPSHTWSPGCGVLVASIHSPVWEPTWAFSVARLSVPIWAPTRALPLARFVVIPEL